jgi:hypothetical protein
MGARPHPPRQVYRAYLAQSQVFAGVFWQSYGLAAPGEDISGWRMSTYLMRGVDAVLASLVQGRE